MNLIFGRNLRQLCDERGTYSEAARILDVSRVQLTRYFKGESYPKPNQLARICTLFDVDGRIYTEPLDDLRRALDGPPAAPPQVPVNDPVLAPGLDRYLTSDHPLPSGLHMMYRPSFTLPGHYVIQPLLVRRTNRGTMVRGVDVVPLGTKRADSGLIERRSFRGLALATPDGVVMNLYGTGAVAFLGMAHFASSGFFMATGMFRGTFELFRPPQQNEFRRVPVILEILPQRAKSILPAVRRSGIHLIEKVPERYRPFISVALAA